MNEKNDRSYCHHFYNPHPKDDANQPDVEPYPIFKSEIELIRQRRQHPEKDELSNQPGTEHELVGLALSGGGIRSATFNLGLLQALCCQGILRRIDYLSTVSGGGFIGSSLTSLLSACKGSPDELLSDAQFPFSNRQSSASETPSCNSTGSTESEGTKSDAGLKCKAGIEKEPVRHLRYYSNYLTTAGNVVGKYMRPALVFLRGMVLNFFTLTPWLLAIMILLSLLFTLRSNLNLDDPITNNLLFDLPQFESALNDMEANDRLQWTYVMDQTRDLPTADFGTRLTYLTTKEKAWPNEISASRRKPLEKALKEAWRPVWMLPLLIFGVTMVLAACFASRASNFDTRFKFSKILGRLLLVNILILLVYLFGASIPLISHLDLPPELSFFSVLVLLAPKLLQMIGGEIERTKKKPWIKIATAVFLLALVPLALLTLIGIGVHYLTAPVLDIAGWLPPVWQRYLFALGMLCVFALSIPLIDVNRISWHNFYRDRLSKAFLMEPQDGSSSTPFDAICHRDDLKLSAIGEKGPYHILNVNLNRTKELPFSPRQETAAHPRKNGVMRTGESFIFSKYWCGSEKTGYRQTTCYENLDDHLDLGTAMAISGGAASIGMGLVNIPFLRLLMGLLNIRLGYWAHHPMKPFDEITDQGEPPKCPQKRRTIDNLRKALLSVREWFKGYNNDAVHFINLSDGGHFENLGAYELLRRRCKYIIIGDAEADPQMSFNGLSNLIRLARIDFGIIIDINIDDIRTSRNNCHSHSHCAVGEIKYPAMDGLKEEKGFLLYCKSSVSGDEPEHLHEYKVRHPSFPHESTADQWFDEQQFEVYRELGYHIGKAVFTPCLYSAEGKFPQKTFELLNHFWHPSNATSRSHFSEDGKALSGILDQLRKDQDLAFLDDLIHRQWKINQDNGVKESA